MDEEMKPRGDEVTGEQLRVRQERLTLRRQTWGLLVVAGLIVLWWLFHTNPKWIFTQGWWRLW